MVNGFTKILSEFKPTFDINNNEIKKIPVDSNKELQVGGYTLVFKVLDEVAQEDLAEGNAEVTNEGDTDDSSQETLTNEVDAEGITEVEETEDSFSDEFIRGD